MRRSLLLGLVFFSSLLLISSSVQHLAPTKVGILLLAPSSSNCHNSYATQIDTPEIKLLSVLEKTRSLNLGPIVGNISQNPSMVEYSDTPIITCDVLENTSSISHVTLFYRVDNGTWTSIPMANITRAEYSTVIPAQPWLSFVEYYINATDISSFSTIQMNGSSYYHYTIIDETRPQVIIDSPPDARIIPGGTIVNITIRAYDEGSSIQRVELTITESQSISDYPIINRTFSSAPYTYAWNTTTAIGWFVYAIEALAFDYAGNLELAQVIMGVVNEIPPQPLLPLLTPLAVAISVIVAIVLLLYWFTKEKEVAE
ncbi:MAG: Ig-like domain-containing protein [Promethearchaeota archaeon]